MNSNKELLDWAVENIEEWDDEFTHLRGDSSIVSIFFTKGNWVISGRNIDWVGDFLKRWV